MPSISSAEESLPLEEREAREQDVNSGAPHFNIKTRWLPKLPPQDVNTKEKRVITAAQQHGKRKEKQGSGQRTTVPLQAVKEAERAEMCGRERKCSLIFPVVEFNVEFNNKVQRSGWHTGGRGPEKPKTRGAGAEIATGTQKDKERKNFINHCDIAKNLIFFLTSFQPLTLIRMRRLTRG
jgi:hypothetical protein